LACGASTSAEERGAILPSETPATFTPRTDEFDYIKRQEMVPMRDGVMLKTFILIPKGAKDAPILLTRTPYNASERVLRFNSPHLAAAVAQMDDTAVAAGYIIVYQDVRGKYGSEGDYVMNRPLKGPLNPTDVHRRFLRRVYHGDVDGTSTPGAQGCRAVRTDGRRLDW
jgi:predicted acyl esterase